MKTRTDKSPNHHRGSANVYADLGYKSADEMLVKAQTSRGADLTHGSSRERLQSLIALFIPFIHSTLRRASELAVALDSRGYEVQGRQTPLHDTALSAADYVVMLAVVVITLGALLI